MLSCEANLADGRCWVSWPSNRTKNPKQQSQRARQQPTVSETGLAGLGRGTQKGSTPRTAVVLRCCGQHATCSTQRAVCSRPNSARRRPAVTLRSSRFQGRLVALVALDALEALEEARELTLELLGPTGPNG